MPNHVTTELHAAKHVLDSLAGENGEVDFNSVIPMPDTVFRGDLGIAERATYGQNNWYDWSVNRWGTKWNAYSIDRVSDEVMRFDTAWAHPAPVIKALSKKFPGESVQAEYADEDLGQNIGAYIMVDGVIEDFNPMEEGSEEALEFAANLKYGMPYAELQAQWQKEES